MASATARQGRPKGSGIDDSRQLARIAVLLATDPKLKPTTAIRSLGIEEPSVIRRLRDKYRTNRVTLEAAARKQSAPKKKPAATTGHGKEPEQQPAPASPSRFQASPSINWDSTTADIFVAWYAAGLSAIGAAIDNQYAITQHLLRQPSVSLGVKSQLLLNEFASAFYQRTKRQMLHPS